MQSNHRRPRSAEPQPDEEEPTKNQDQGQRGQCDDGSAAESLQGVNLIILGRTKPQSILVVRPKCAHTLKPGRNEDAKKVWRDELTPVIDAVLFYCQTSCIV